VLYSYDNIGQLAVATSSASSENRGYAYDHAWNLQWLTNNGTASAYQVNVDNELTNVASRGLKYDANGNLTNKVTDSGGDYNAYIYDDENRLIDVQNLSIAYETVFIYDGLGRLRIRQEYEGAAEMILPLLPTAGLPLVNVVNYIYDGWRVVQERNSNNVPQVSYTRGPDLSGSLQGAGGIGGLLARSSGYSSGNWTSHDYYHADGNGNITCLVDTNQMVVASYRYDPFGNTLSESGTLAATNVYRFSSKEVHVNSGMYYYGYRFYDPNLQRWPNRDPIAEPGFATLRDRLQKEARRGANQYQFNLNDPCDFVDTEGLTVYVCSRPTQIPIIGPITTHVYFYDDDPEHGPSQSCSEQNKSGGPGTVNSGDLPPSQNPNCTPIEGTGEPGQDNDRARAIMSCCEKTINNGPYIPFANDCHNRLNRCLSAGGGYFPIKHPRIGPPTVKPIFSPMSP
jgi:RHS repeat-associated protein